MFDKGLVAEVEDLLKMGVFKGMYRDAGYWIQRETAAYINGEYTLDEAKDAIKQGSRRYAKRQLTWFRANKNIKCFQKMNGGNCMSKQSLNLQDVFLNQARKEKNVLNFIMVNGYQFKGIVSGFDNYTVVLESEGRQNLVYKHAISTIVPSKPIVFYRC